MGVPNSEVGYTTPQPEGRPRSSGEHVVALGEEKKINNDNNNNNNNNNNNTNWLH
jgi:hypothetical protein